MDVNNTVYKIAETRSEIEGSTSLVYKNYLEQGYCSDNSYHQYLYLFDAMPENRVLVALNGDAVQATLTLVFDGVLGLPSDKLYSEELKTLRNKGRSVVEISRLSADKKLGVHGIKLLKGVFRLAWLIASQIRKATDFVVLIEPHHEAFYRKLLCFERIGEIKPDPDASDAPSLLLRLDLEQAPEIFRNHFGEKSSPDNMYWFFVKDPQLEKLRDEAEKTDLRLKDLHRRLINSEKFSPLDQRESDYLEFWLFMLRYNIEKTLKTADILARSTMFPKAIELYEKLLMALPINYEPERRSEVFLYIAMCAWNGGMYEKAVQLAQASRSLKTDPDIEARAWATEAVSHFFLGREKEAKECIQKGLAVPNASKIARAVLFRSQGRMELETGSRAISRSLLLLAWRDLKKTHRPGIDPAWVDRFRSNLGFDLYVAEHTRGNIKAARKCLDENMSSAKTQGAVIETMYLQGYARLSMLEHKYEQALGLIDQALSKIANDNLTPYMSWILRMLKSEALLMIGLIDEARETLELVSKLNGFLRRPKTAVETAGQIMALMFFENKEHEGMEMFLKTLKENDEKLPLRAKQSAALQIARFAIENADAKEAEKQIRMALPNVHEEPWMHANVMIYDMFLRLLKGQIDEAYRIWGKLPRQASFPGNVSYASSRLLAGAILSAVSGRDSNSKNFLLKAVSKHSNGKADGAITIDILTFARIVNNTVSLKNCPESLRACRDIVSRADSAGRFPKIKPLLESFDLL